MNIVGESDLDIDHLKCIWKLYCLSRQNKAARNLNNLVE